MFTRYSLLARKRCVNRVCVRPSVSVLLVWQVFFRDTPQGRLGNIESLRQKAWGREEDGNVLTSEISQIDVHYLRNRIPLEKINQIILSSPQFCKFFINILKVF